MVSSSKFESLAQRFAPYIDELQDFFRSRGVPFGTPADLQNFPSQLRDPAFHEEMGSMVRAIVYGESEAVPRAELADMLAIAVGGRQVEEAAPELHEPLHAVLLFVTEVVRSQRAASRPEMSLDDEVSGAPAVELPVSPAVLPPGFEEAPELQPRSIPEPPPRMSSLPMNDRLSRALIDSEAKVDVGPVPEPGGAGTTPEARTFVSEPPPASTSERFPSHADRRSPPRSFRSFLRQAYWIPGVCVLLLAVAVAYYLHAHSHPQSAAVPEQTTAVANPGSPKPSAYVPPLDAADSRGQRSPLHGNGTAADPGTFSPSQPGSRPLAGERAASPAGTHSSFAGSARHSGLPSALSSSSIAPRVLGGREGVFLASSGMMAAHLLTAPAPRYPKLASIAHVEGEVIVQVVVARDGRVEATRVLEGPRLLRSAPVHAIRRWRYRPYLVDGKPTDVATIVTVNFRLSR